MDQTIQQKAKGVVVGSTAGVGTLISSVAAAISHQPVQSFTYGGIATIAALVAFGRGQPELYEGLGRFLDKRKRGEPMFTAFPNDGSLVSKIGNAMMGVRYDDPPQPAASPVRDADPSEPPSSSREEEPKVRPSEISHFIGDNPDRRILISDEFQPDGNTMVSTGAIAFGSQGSGKTTVLARIFEQYIGKYEIPCLIFCSQGDFVSIVKDGICTRGLIATPARMPSAKDILSNRLQVVVDLNAWHKPGHIGVCPDLAVPMMAELIHGLIVEQSVIDPENRVPVIVGLDEVHLWVPQGPTRRMTQDNSVRMYDAAVELTTTGRKYGVVPFFATQRIALVDKDVIGSFETRFFGKVDQDVDVKRYWEYLPKTFTETTIRSLEKGKMIVTFGGKHVLTQVYNRESTHISHTPRVSRSLVGQKSRMSPEQIAQIISVSQAPTPEMAEDEEETEEQQEVHYNHGYRRVESAQVRNSRRLANLRSAPVTRVVVRKSVESVPVPSLEEVEAAFPKGLPSKRAIMAHFGIKDNKAWKIYNDLKEKRGYA